MKALIYHKRSLRGAVITALLHKLIQKKNYDAFALPNEKPQEAPWAVPKEVVQTVFTLPNASAELLSQGTARKKKLVFQIHGGGFTEGLTNARRNVGLQLLRRCPFADVLLVDYRIAPKAAHPAALSDVLDAWQLALSLGYASQDIAVMGDSAGGNLLFALLLTLRQKNMAMPCGAWGLAPLADAAGRGVSFRTNLYRDAVLGKPENYLPLQSTPEPKLHYAQGADCDDALLSPIFGDFTAFPPLLLQVGTWDMLLSDSIALHEKALTAGVSSTLSLTLGGVHAFQFGPKFIPEVKAAWSEGCAFLNKILK